MRRDTLGIKSDNSQYLTSYPMMTMTAVCETIDVSSLEYFNENSTLSQQLLTRKTIKFQTNASEEFISSGLYNEMAKEF